MGTNINLVLTLITKTGVVAKGITLEKDCTSFFQKTLLQVNEFFNEFFVTCFKIYLNVPQCIAFLLLFIIE
jgi:hypothetical protein